MFRGDICKMEIENVPFPINGLLVFVLLIIFIKRCIMSTASISKDFSIRSQKMADSLLDALVRSGKKSKWVSQNSKNKTTEMKRISKLFAK